MQAHEDRRLVPISSHGRPLVEQSQTRVEAPTFDTRKHLLEYDDVLNAQRAPSIPARPIFTKDDLTEDVETCSRQLAARPQALDRRGGPWALLLARTDQPTLLLTPPYRLTPSALLEACRRPGQKRRMDGSAASAAGNRREALEVRKPTCSKPSIPSGAGQRAAGKAGGRPTGDRGVISSSPPPDEEILTIAGRPRSC